MQRWLRRFLADDIFDVRTVRTAMEEEFTVARSALPQRAPHFSLTVRERAAGVV